MREAPLWAIDSQVLELASGEHAAPARQGRLRTLRGLFSSPTAPVVLPVCAAATVVLGLAIWGGVGHLAGPAVALLVAATLAEAFPVPIEHVTAGSTSFANVFIVTAAVIYGWRTAVVIGALSMLSVEIYRRTPVTRVAYNSALYVLAAAAAGLAAQPLPETHRIGLVSSLCFYLVDVILLAAVVTRIRRERYDQVARSFFVSTLPPFVVMAAITAILVQLWRSSPWWSLLLVPPLVAIGMHQRSLLETVRRQRELDTLKDEFIAVISHELRTPLASVYGAAVTLEERSVDDDTRQRLLNVIRRESKRLATVVNDVLWASRLEAKKVTVEPEWCDADALVREAAARAAEIAPANVSIVAGGDSVAAHVPAEQLRMVLANLIDNAVKYSPQGGTIDVRVAEHNGGVRFSVSDQGMGVPEAERERIFDKFIRLDPEMSRGIGGTGLGLYICRELVAQMGGTIWVSANKPRGSTFTVELRVTGEGGGKS
jgi:signal transduction histidine kinase